jgi:hypothetical protein
MADEGTAEAGTATEVSSESVQAATPTLGDGLFATDTNDGAVSAPEGGNPDPATNNNDTAFDPSTVDLLRVKVDEVPDEHRQMVQTYQGIARNHQSLLDQKIQEADMRTQQLEQRSRDLESEWRTRLENVAQGGQQDEYAGLTERQRAGLQMVQDLVNRQVGDVPSQLGALQDEVASLRQERQNSARSEQQQQIADARTKYGTDVDSYGTQIAALSVVKNPVSGRNYTVTEAYELVSGKATMAAADLKKAERQTTTGAKQAISGVVSTPVGAVVDDDGGTLTDSQVNVALAKLFGEN